jgi:hypothetical protein
VRYVTIPVSNYLSKATVEAAAVEEYYDTHTDEFTVDGTNGTKTVSPLEESRNAISNLLVKESATQTARDVGTDMVVSLAPARDGTASVFEKVAETLGFNVRTTGLFDAAGPVPDIDGEIEFITAAFKLRPTPDDYFSDAVMGNNSVYILALSTNAEAYVPSFDQVRVKVEPLARQKAVQDALSRKAESIRRKFQEGLSQNETFATLAKQQSINVSTTSYFSAYSAPESLSSRDLLEAIVTLNRGEISDLLSTTNGYMIAFVADRKPASEDEAAAVRNQLGANVSRRRTRILFSEWQDIIVKAGHKNNEAPVEETPAEE